MRKKERERERERRETERQRERQRGRDGRGGGLVRKTDDVSSNMLSKESKWMFYNLMH